MNRTRLLYFIPVLFISICSFSADTTQLAPVAVSVTDLKGKPSKGEQVFFTGEKTQRVFSGRSDAAGRFFIQLPAGDKYFITIKSIVDTSKYGVIEIPAIGADEEYTEPFKVNVKYELAKSYRLDRVYFDFGKATLRPESFIELGELVDFMKNREAIRIEIAGHTDNIGKEADNLKLSQQRAEAIRNYLLKKGIQPARVIARGYGAELPIADNSTDEGRQKNRRTEVKIL